MKASADNQPSEKALLDAIANRNELAFAQFYELNWDSLFMAAFKVLKDEETCKDIVQEVFLSFWNHQNHQEIANVQAYLHQSVRYRVLMMLRKSKISERHLELMRNQAENTTEILLEYQELNQTVEQSIQSLPAKCQEVFRLSRFEHLSNREIADRLNISVRTVETHIGNALRKLKRSLDSSSGYQLTRR